MAREEVVVALEEVVVPTILLAGRLVIKLAETIPKGLSDEIARIRKGKIKRGTLCMANVETEQEKES